MGAFTDAAKQAMLSAWAIDKWVALFVGGVELTGTSYGRQALGAVTYDSETDQISNDAQIVFTSSAPADWDTPIDEMRIYDAETAGTLHGDGIAVSPSQPVVAGNAVTIEAGALTMQLADAA